MRVVIIGGGIIGALIALRLKDLGAEPVVLERKRLGAEASWAGAGILCPIQPWLYPDAFTHLVEASLALWPSLAEELRERGGMEIEFFRTGMLVPFARADDPECEEALAWSRRFGWRVEDISGEALQREEPLLAPQIQRGLLWPDVAQARNPRVLKAARTALVRAGVELRERTEVVELVRDGDRIGGVRTRSGEMLAAQAVVLAAGAWSGRLGKRFGIALPVEPVKGQIVLVRARPGLLRHIVKHARVYAVPRKDGRVLVGATMERADFDRRPTQEARAALLGAVHEILPGLLAWPIERQWTGFRPGSPDGLPFLGPVRAHPGLWVATGHYRNGVLLAPITAEIIAHWIAGKSPALDMAPFAPERPVQADARLGYPAG